MDRESKQYRVASAIVKRLQEAGYTTLFAGGVVRDMLIAKENNDDIDIATVATPKEIEKLFKNVHGVGESFGVMLVVEEGIPYEVATFREEGEYLDGRHPEVVHYSTPEEDAKRRDFTINGMFFDPIAEKLYDFIGGEEDLNNKIIRTIGDPFDRFSEDYLRMLRAVRFSVRFNFPIEENTWAALCKLHHHITEISIERIFVELNKMLIGRNPSKAIRMLSDCGLLELILPEIEKMKGVEQPIEFHEHDVFDHTMKVLDGVGENPTEVLAWSALLHDVGKPATQTFEDRIRFNGHDHAGAKISEKILRRMKVSNALCEQVVACVDNHMHFISVQQMRTAKVKRFLARPTIEDELNLHVADCNASHGSIDNFTFLRAKQEEYEAIGVQPDPLIQGRDLIKRGLRPGPTFGPIIAAAYDAQLEGDIVTDEDAELWLNEYLEKNQS